MPTAAPTSRLRKALKSVAIFEALKGLAALLGLLGLLSLLHRDLHQLAVAMIGHLGLPIDAHGPATLVQWADRLGSTPARTVLLLGGSYVVLRWVEAWGLWHDRTWGEWLGALSSGLFIPFEIRHVLAHRHWQVLLVLLLNLVLVAVLLLRLYQRSRSRMASSGPNRI